MGLVEGHVAAAFRRSGISMQHIRKALTILKKEIGVEHALASKALYTDGATILYDYAKQKDHELLTIVLTGQRVFADVIRDYLKLIEYSRKDQFANRLVLPITSHPVIEIDPKRAFGRPLFMRGGAPMSDVIDRFRAGESLRDLVADFDLDSEDVEDVIRAAIPQAA